MADAQTRVVITGDPTGAVKAIKTVGAELGALQAISAKAFALGVALSAQPSLPAWWPSPSRPLTPPTRSTKWPNAPAYR